MGHMLEFNVMDCEDPALIDSIGEASESHGVLKLAFQDLEAGVWHTARKPLCNPEGRTTAHDANSTLVDVHSEEMTDNDLGELEVKIHVAKHMQHILALFESVSSPIVCP